MVHRDYPRQCTSFCGWLREELRKTELMPIGIREVKIPLSPGAILGWGRGQPLSYRSVVEGIDIVDAENGTTPPGRLKMRCQGEIDIRFPSLEGTEPCLRTAIDYSKAQLRVEGDRLWHGPDGKGHGANVVNHAGCLS